MLLTSNQFVITHGNAEANTAPTPIKKVCMAKPLVRCFSGSMSPTKARKGSMETLMLASMIHNMPAANHRYGEFGMMIRQTEAMIAPTRK